MTPMIAVEKRIDSFSSARRLARAGLLPVDEQEPARRSELRLARSGKDLQLELIDLVLRAVQQAIAKSPSRRVRDNSITCTMALSVTRASFL